MQLDYFSYCHNNTELLMVMCLSAFASFLPLNTLRFHSAFCIGNKDSLYSKLQIITDGNNELKILDGPYLINSSIIYTPCTISANLQHCSL